MQQDYITYLKSIQAYTPVLNKIACEYTAKQSPLSGVKIAIIFHLTNPVVQMMLCLQKAGAEIFFIPSKVETIVPASLKLLKQTAISYIIPQSDKKNEILEAMMSFKPNLLIDNAYLFDLWHEKENLPSVSGATVHSHSAYNIVEKYQNAHAPIHYPIIGIGASNLKLELESTLGTGQSVVNALINVTQLQLNAKKIAIVGYGNVGMGVASVAHAMGGQILIVEKDAYRALKARLFDGYEVLPLEQAITTCDIMITATGGKNVLTSNHFSLFKDGAFIGNVGRYQEIDVPSLEKQANEQNTISNYITAYEINAHKLYLMTAGEQLNHIAGEGNSSEIMDLSLGLHILSMEYLWTQRDSLSNKIYAVPESITETIAATKLQTLGLSYL